MQVVPSNAFTEKIDALQEVLASVLVGGSADTLFAIDLANHSMQESCDKE